MEVNNTICNRPIFFDIDIVTIKDFVSSWEELSFELNKIHDFIRSIFDETRTEIYTKFINSWCKLH